MEERAAVGLVPIPLPEAARIIQGHEPRNNDPGLPASIILPESDCQILQRQRRQVFDGPVDLSTRVVRW